MNCNTLLYRQVHPSFVANDKVTSQAFKPTKKDRLLLSVYNGDMITPQKAWFHYTDVLGYLSYEIVAVSVSECSAQGLPVYSDPSSYREHTVIDFTNLSRNQIERRADSLRNAAVARDWQFSL